MVAADKKLTSNPHQSFSTPSEQYPTHLLVHWVEQNKRLRQ
jgi:hypothetical protein